MHVLVVVGIVGLLSALAPTVALAKKHKPKPIPAATAFILPSPSRCVSGRALTVEVRRVPGVAWLTATVSINGRRVKTIVRSRVGIPVKISGLPTTGFSLRVVATTRDERTATATRSYRPCATTPAVASSHRLSVTLTGNGSGSVMGNGIACPGTCTHTYPRGTVVRLAATATAGSTFSGWSGGGCGGTGGCTVTLGSDQSVAATFAANPPPQRTLSVTVAGSGSGSVAGGGISCPGTCSRSYANGTQVTLTASPGVGSTFTGWSGGCAGTGACTVTLSSDQAVTATFAAGISPASPLPAVSSGSYSGASAQGGGVTFYVSPDDTQIQDVEVSMNIACSPSFSFGGGEVELASIPIAADGSFSRIGDAGRRRRQRPGAVQLRVLRPVHGDGRGRRGSRGRLIRQRHRLFVHVELAVVVGDTAGAGVFAVGVLAAGGQLLGQ